MKHHLTALQRALLRSAADHPVGAFVAAASRPATEALLRVGFVRQDGYHDTGRPTYRITSLGRQALLEHQS